MKVRIMVIDSNGFFRFVKTSIKTQIPSININDVIMTDSFDHALEVMPKDQQIIVISSYEFHDRLSMHRDLALKSLYKEKNGGILAMEMKKQNSNCKFFIFSSARVDPKYMEYIEIHLKKNRIGEGDISEFIEEIKRAII